MKRKTKQAAVKRFTISARGKVRHRPIGQAHFNARANGNETRRKHPYASVDETDMDRLIQLLPHNF